MVRLIDHHVPEKHKSVIFSAEKLRYGTHLQ